MTVDMTYLERMRAEDLLIPTPAGLYFRRGDFTTRYARSTRR
jgi:hypothetical protein